MLMTFLVGSDNDLVLAKWRGPILELHNNMLLEPHTIDGDDTGEDRSECILSRENITCKTTNEVRVKKNPIT